MCVFKHPLSNFLANSFHSSIHRFTMLTLCSSTRQIVIETVVSLIICFAAAALLAGRLRPIKITQIAALKYVTSSPPANLPFRQLLTPQFALETDRGTPSTSAPTLPLETIVFLPNNLKLIYVLVMPRSYRSTHFCWKSRSISGFSIRRLCSPSATSMYKCKYLLRYNSLDYGHSIPILSFTIIGSMPARRLPISVGLSDAHASHLQQIVATFITMVRSYTLFLLNTTTLSLIGGLTAVFFCNTLTDTLPPLQARELISPEGLRIDGRRANEIRRIKCEMGLFERADGSAYFEQGNTRVLCAVYGPREVRYSAEATHRALLPLCSEFLVAIPLLTLCWSLF